MQKICGIILVVVIIICAALFAFFFVGSAPVQKNITWGVNFSQMQSEFLGLNWKENYTALLADLGVRHIKLITNWDFIEGKKDTFYFNDTDWQVQQAQNYNASLIYVVGMKTGRWPECHVPTWAGSLSKAEQQQEILTYITQTVDRYKSSKAIVAWQAENEPLFNFGICPWYDQTFLTKEVALIKSLDPSRPVIISDSGEQSLWFNAARIGDIVGITMYKKVWMHIAGNIGFYFDYPFPPVFYYRKAELVDWLFGKPVISTELQAEPWVNVSFEDASLAEQAQTMNPAQFETNISFAKQTGLKEFYLWGAEWWYWMKVKQHQPAMWNEAKGLFQKNGS